MVDPMQEAFGNMPAVHGIERVAESAPGMWGARCHCGAIYWRNTEREARRALNVHLNAMAYLRVDGAR